MENIDNDAINAFHTMNIYLGILNMFILIIVAPFLSALYNKPIILSLTIVYSISVLFNSFSQQTLNILTRSKKFDKLFYINTSSLIAGIGSAIGSAYSGLGVWSLIIKLIVDKFVKLVGTKIVLNIKYKFVPIYTIKKYKESLKFSVEIVVFRLLSGFIQSLDKLIFGKFYSVQVLGQYERASTLALKPDSSIRTSLSTPALAHMARFKNEKKIDSYRLITNVLFIISCIPCLILIVMGDWIIPWLMGDQWHNAAEYVQILGIWGIGKIIQGIVTIIFLNEIKANKLIKINAIAFPFILTSPLLFAIMKFQPIYFISALSIATFIFWSFVMLYYLYVISDSINISVSVVRTMLTLILPVIMIGYYIKDLFINYNILFQSNLLNILILILVLLTIIIVAQILMNYKQSIEIFNLIKTKI